MFLPSKILSEIEAIKKLKKIKVSAFNVFLSGVAITGCVVVYVKILEPLRESVEYLPQVKVLIDSVNTKLDQHIKASVDTSIYETIRNTNKQVTELKETTRQMAEKLKIVGEEIPGISKRFDDLQRGFDSQFNELKKKELSMI
jgi:hypothetical protein